MKAIKRLIGEWSYMVIDSPSNRFNFCDLVEIDEAILADAENGTEWSLSDNLPEDVRRAVDTMENNDVNISDFTGVVTYDDDDYTYYVLVW